MSKSNNPKTGIEVMMIENAKHHAKMQWRMAKALVKGRVDSQTLRFAESMYYAGKEIYEQK